MLLRAIYYFYELKRNLSLSVSKLQDIQRKKLRAMITHAYENVAFYHRRFDEAGIKPGDIRSVDDLSKIPVVTKPEIQATPLTDVLARGFRAEKCVKTSTSGSTGKPMVVYFDKGAADFRFALLSRTYWEDGIRPWDKMAKITYPYELRKAKGESRYPGLARRKHISVFDDANTQLAILQSYKPDIINSFPSSLVILAHACNENDIRIRPRLITTGAELLYSNDRDLIRSTFECDSVDDYGCQEIGPLAWECREHMGHHVNIDSLVMEILDDGEQVAPGEQGEIACTSLVDYSMPFIRYSVGDQGVPLSEECSCGRPLPLMNVSKGRKDDFLTALDGRIVSPLFVAPSFFFGSVDAVKQFRIIQERTDKLIVQFAQPKSPLDDKTLERACTEIRKILGEGVQVEYQQVDKIERDASGKQRKVISHVPVKWRS